MSAPDGLSALQAKRDEATGRRHRQAPPPRHPRAVVDLDEPVVDVREDAAQDVETPSTQPAVDEQASERPAMVRKAPGRPKKADAASRDQSLRPAQFYVGAEVDDYLRQVRSQALVRRLDVTASAVVRLAMERLMTDFTPEQITDQLAQPLAGQKGAGRKRR